MPSLKDAVIVAYGRAPIAKAGKKGAYRETHPVDLAGIVLNAVLAKVPQIDPKTLDDVIVGCAKPEGVQSFNMARLVASRAGCGWDVPGQTVNRFCSSSLQTISTAANTIMTGQSELIAAGGVESMTAIPMGSKPEIWCRWIADNDPGQYLPMGMTAENVAARYGITREEMDAFAVESHKRAAFATKAGRFKEEIIPIPGIDADGNPITLSEDQGIRSDSTLEGLAGLKPAFKEEGGIVTAGQASQVSDGSAFVILASAEKAAKLGIVPLAKLVGFAVAGVDPSLMGIGPIKAVPKIMALTGLTVDRMDVVELNEAFAAQAIPCIRELKLDPAKVNPNGGAIALGHPLGATGAVLTCKALSELKRVNGRYALITMCIGGGIGGAGIIERL
jgi:acetyl-CoA acyltransferase